MTIVKSIWLCCFILLLAAGTTLNAQHPKGLDEGDEAPLFEAVDQFGEPVNLSELLEQGKVVLLFYRGHWCKYCNRQLEDLSDSLSYIINKGASVITVTPEVMEFVDETSKKYGGSFRIISDTGMNLMNKYAVTFKVNEGTVTRYKSRGINLEQFNGENGAYLPVPAAYVIGQDGTIHYSFFNEDYKKRVTVSTILSNL